MMIDDHQKLDDRFACCVMTMMMLFYYHVGMFMFVVVPQSSLGCCTVSTVPFLLNVAFFLLSIALD